MMWGPQDMYKERRKYKDIRHGMRSFDVSAEGRMVERPH